MACPYHQHSLGVLVVLWNASTMHQEYHSMQAGASYDAVLLCHVEPWMHEIERPNTSHDIIRVSIPLR